jgi:hypothetical protein
MSILLKIMLVKLSPATFLAIRGILDFRADMIAVQKTRRTDSARRMVD